MDISTLLSGAGQVSTGVREREEELRRAREDQLRIEELNRMDRARREMAAAPIPQPGSFGPAPDKLPVLPGASPSAPAAPAAPAAPRAGVQVNKPLPMQTGTVGYAEAMKDIQPGQLTRDRFLALPKKEQQRIYEQYRQELAKYNRQALGSRDEFGVRIPTGLPQRRVAATLDEYVQSLPQQYSGPSNARGRPRKAAPGAPAGLAVTFDDAVNNVLTREGGYVNDAADRGGETNLGISSNANPDVDVANLTTDQAKALYRERYWDAIGGDSIPPAIRELAFDTAVNMGPSTARRLVELSGGDPQRFLAERKKIYDAIVANDPSQRKFYNGWMNRLEELAGRVAGGIADTVMPTAEAAPVGDVSMPALGVQGGGTGVVRQQLSPGQFYMANPEAISQDMRLAMQQREELVRMAGIYQRAGMGQQFMEVRQQIMAHDAKLLDLAGMQGVREFKLANDPRRLAQAWGLKEGVPINLQPRTDGTYDVLVNGKLAASSVPAAEIMDTALSTFDPAYRERKGAWADKEFEAQLKVREVMAGETGKMIREIYLAQQNGMLNERLEVLKSRLNWDIKGPDSSGTYLIRPPGDTPFYYDPAGGTVEIDGIEVPITGARRITGLTAPAGR